MARKNLGIVLVLGLTGLVVGSGPGSDDWGS